MTALGTLKYGAVFCPLFSAFGPEPIRQRLDLSGARVLVTTSRIFRRKVADLLPQLPSCATSCSSTATTTRRCARSTSVACSPGSTRTSRSGRPPPEQLALLHFTSGSTGTPKGALHVHRAVVAHRSSARYALDLHPGDTYWCTADPGWVTGTSYGLIAPLTLGVTTVVDEAEFDPRRWYGILADHRVNVWYTSPTAIRMLMRSGAELATGYDLSSLQFIASVGEPLNPEAIWWGQSAFGQPIHDNWWQTETGGIMIANFPTGQVRPGSMGRPLPGIEAALVAVDEQNQPVLGDDGPELVVEPGCEGMLALRTGWPSMFQGYLHEHERYERCFADGWYLSGDLAERDPDGWYWFVGRADDVIKTSGHLIGPFEVESVLMEHPSVVEAGVIGVPDEVAGNLVKAFVTLAPGVEWSDELRLELVGFARSRLGASVAPRLIAHEQHLPRTWSGKIMRRLLRACELGCPRATCRPWSPSRRPHRPVPEPTRGPTPSTPRSRRDPRPHPADRVARGPARRGSDGPPAPDAGDPTLRGAVRRAVLRGRDPRLPAPLHRRGGRRDRRDVEAGPEGQRRVDLPGARPRAGSGHLHDRGHGRAAGSGRRLQRRTGRLDAPVRRDDRFYGGNAIVASALPVATGLALADQMAGSDAVTVCFFGEGAVAEGEFHESMNLAALWNLPVLFCCENNLYAMGTALDRSESQVDIAAKAASYQMPAWAVDGMDVLAVRQAARRAVEAVRGGGGPVFLELHTYRFRAHSMYDPERYRDHDEVESWKERDPIDRWSTS